MECKSQFSEPDFFETEGNCPDFIYASRDEITETSALKAFGRQLRVFGSLFITFVKLYFQARWLVMQNHILSCKLRMWEVVFLYYRIQIFFTRLAHGFPVAECWPRK